MSDIAIRVDNLSKKYQIVTGKPRHVDFQEQISVGLKSLFRRNGRSQQESQTFWALKDVSFEVKQGEVIGVIGRNGAGKSTLLKILSKITEPATGVAEIRGRVGSLLEVGTGFHPELTGRENIFLNGAMLGMKKAEIDRKLDEIVDFSEVETFIDTPVKRYSSGMYVRLAFAVAAHLEPEILLVDEVLAVGDASFQRKCLGKMGDVSKKGRTILFVSHNMAAVTQLCPKTVWLEGGKIQKIDASVEVVKEYLSEGNSQVPERQWTYPGNAPGDDRVRLLAARVLQQKQIASVIDINIPSQIEIEFQILRDVENLITGVNVYDAMDLCLFANCDWRPNRLAPGRYRKRVELPAQLFAEGRLSMLIQLVFEQPRILSVVLRNALTVDAVDSDHPLSIRGQYKGEWPGAVRVGLSWSDAEQFSRAGFNEQPQSRFPDVHSVDSHHLAPSPEFDQASIGHVRRRDSQK